ncbi:restriction endonuclease subunit S [Citrobacter portucalensis]
MSKNWQRCQLGDVLNLINGRAYKKEEMLTEGVPILRIQNLNGGNNWFYSNLDLAEDKYCYKDDLLYAWSATFGPYWSKWDHKLIYHYHIWKIETSSVLYKQFAYYALWNITEALKASAHGVAMPHITKAGMEAWEIDLPPLTEQKIIAEKLDTLLAQVDSTKARLEQIPQILKRFRQAVLAAATSGKLTEEWRSKNINAPIFSANSDCLKHFRNAELPVIPESWQWLRFDQIAEIASNLKSPLDYPNTTHIAPNHIESWTGKVFGYQTIFEDGVTSAKHEFYKGQIIYSKIRPYLCKVAIATFDGLCSADMYPINSKIDTHFLFRWMLTTTFTDWASNAESRTVLPKINQKDLSEIPVPTPPLLEQLEIVRRVEQLFAYADTIEKQVNNALTRVNSLTQSILAKAFRGELTAQWRAENPDLISGENSAAALLEKIKAERTASGGKKTSRKKA